jgi:hypothetical protein
MITYDDWKLSSPPEGEKEEKFECEGCKKDFTKSELTTVISIYGTFKGYYCDECLENPTES